MPRSALTQIQRRVLSAFEEAVRDGDAPPTYRELCRRFGWVSTATARDHLSALRRKGFLQRTTGARNHRLVCGRVELRSLRNTAPELAKRSAPTTSPAAVAAANQPRVVHMPPGLARVTIDRACLDNIENVVSMIHDGVATRHVLSPSPPTSEKTPPELAASLRKLGARIASAGCLERASEADLGLMRALMEIEWRWTPVIQLRPGAKSYTALRLPHQAGWHIALTKIFENAPMFLVDLLSNTNERSRERREMNALAHVLRLLVVSGADIPPRMHECFRSLANARSIAQLPLPQRDYAEMAATMLGGLLLPNGKLRVTYEKKGGRGHFSAWGAASRFADAFKIPMPTRLREAKRPRKRQ